ncbi:carnitine transporter, partial [Massospora cicadina]
MSDPTGPSSSQVGCNPPLIEGNRRTSLSSVKAFLSGGFGGIRLVRMQTSVPGEFNGLLDCWRCVFRSSGVRGIYRGVLPPLLGTFVGPFGPWESGEKLGPLPTTVAGGLSAFPTVLLATPGERAGVPDASLEPAAQTHDGGGCAPSPSLRGLRSLYKGTTITLIRDVPGSMAYFATYDILKTLFSKPTCPNDLGISQAYRDLIKSEGWGGLYRGLGPAMLRAFPANAACFYGKSTVF